jgi:orotidine-5'-phosphate decarboxylase
MTDLGKKVILALDIFSISEVSKFLDIFDSRIMIFKVGSRLFYSCGPEAVKKIVQTGNDVFFDLKLHDIPNTVSEAAVEATRLGVRLLNMHVTGGSNMMSRAAGAVREKAAEWEIPAPKLLGVTVLTSSSQDDLAGIGISRDIGRLVLDLACLAQDSGLDGVIASGHEVRAIKEKCGKDFMVITPGIRPSWAQSDDQKRVMTPAEAFEAGADYIVIGRPLLRAENPLEALDKLFD